MNQSAIGTLADRSSRYVHLVPCCDAEAVGNDLLAMLASLSETAQNTLT